MNTVIREVTHDLPKQQLAYADECAFLGIDAKDQRIVSIPHDQVLIARHLLSNKPSGSKMHCYAYGPLINYRLERIGYDDNPAFTLTHTFMRIDNEMCAISNIDNETFLFQKRYYAKDPMDVYEVERRSISGNEWRCADQLIDFYQNDQQVLSGNKLRHKQKYYRFFEIIDEDGDGYCRKRIVKMTHTFYHINNKLYALSGNGHHISGTFGKIKIAREYAMQADDAVQSDAELVALKIPKKCRVISKETCDNIRAEYALYQSTGLSSGTAVKQKSVAMNGQQEICVMRFFHADLYENVLEGHLRKLVSHIRLTGSSEYRECLLINLIRSLTDIFLKLLYQLDININQHLFLHRDIKPENIVLTTKPQIDAFGRVVSIQCVDAMFIDFGAAKKIQKPGEWTINEERPVGTLDYLAPEINHGNVSARYPLCYTDKTEIFAFGKTLQFTLRHLFESILPYLNNPAHSRSRSLYQQLMHISKMMRFELPVNRIGLEYVCIMLLNTLWQSFCVDSAMNVVQKRESFNAFVDSVKSPFRHSETVTCLVTITRLTGDMIMHRAPIQNSVELKMNLSKDLFLVFCRLDSLITYPRHREMILRLLENVNGILNRWHVAAPLSPIELFEREILQPDYDFLRSPSHSSASSSIGSLVSGVSALVPSTVTTVLSAGGLFPAAQTPLRRQRAENGDRKNDDDDFCP